LLQDIDKTRGRPLYARELQTLSLGARELRQESTKEFPKREREIANQGSWVRTNRETESPARRNRETETFALAQSLALSHVHGSHAHRTAGRRTQGTHASKTHKRSRAPHPVSVRMHGRMLVSFFCPAPAYKCDVCTIASHASGACAVEGNTDPTQMGTTIRQTMAQTSGRNTSTSAS
jgi:hypothetical protein